MRMFSELRGKMYEVLENTIFKKEKKVINTL